MNRLLHPRYLPLLGCALIGLALADAPAKSVALCEVAPTTLIIVRHADRAGQADSLSEAGVARAQELVHVTATADVSTIYHSDTRRTRDTAGPLARALKLELTPYPAKDIKQLMSRIWRDNVGKTVLIVGHSNTVPMIIAEAGAPAIPDIDEREFDGLFIVRMSCPGKKATLLQLQYGAPSP